MLGLHTYEEDPDRPQHEYTSLPVAQAPLLLNGPFGRVRKFVNTAEAR